MKLFLGGTCNQSRWRDIIIPLLSLEYFNPMKEDWTQEMYEEELRQREECDYVMYTITPKMTGVYSIAEVVQDSNVKPDRTIMVLLEDDDGEKFEEFRWRSLVASAAMVTRNGGSLFFSLTAAARFINEQSEKN